MNLREKIAQHPYRKLLSTLLILNLCDLLITVFAVAGGYAEEMNPIMGYFLENSPLSFALFKIFVMQLIVLRDMKRYQAINKMPWEVKTLVKNHIYYRHKWLARRFVWVAAIGIYAFTVIWNVITVGLSIYFME